MYIHFNRKYQKIIWLLVGFFACCFLTDKVFAYTMPNGLEINEEYIQNLWDTHIKGKTVQDIQPTCNPANNYPGCYNKFSESETPFNLVMVSSFKSGLTMISFARTLNDVIIGTSGNNTFFRFSAVLPSGTPLDSYEFYYYPQIVINADKTFNRVQGYRANDAVYFATNSSINSYVAVGDFNRFAINFNLVQNDTIIKEKNFDYSSVSTPDYLNGYKKITLTPEDKYYMLSGLSSGSVYIPTSDFEEYGGRLSYYDNELTSQPYTSYIQDYYKMPDGLFIRQDFDLSQFYGADWVMFSKYIYLEGEDNITYDIWVPNDIYDSQVTIIPNSSGGNSFDFDYKDSNGDIQNGQVNSIDLSQDNPLLGNIFSDFSSNTFGLTSIITAPLSLIRSLSSTSCTPLNLPLPFVGGTLTLPCMYSFYSSTFGSLFTLYQTITFGIVAYWVIVRIFNLVKDFKNPDHDEIEVIDL